MSETPTRVHPTPLQSAAQPHDEYLLRRYRVLERRGRGGFGTVCTCWDTRLQRRVAIKRMPLAAETGTTATEALAEARTACMLGHPNIVTVFDFESDGTFAYLVMEYVDGLNLAELLGRVEGGRLTPAECAHVLQSVARALAQSEGLACEVYTERAEGARPALATQVEDLSRYDVIFLGYPNWNADLPMPLYTFLESVDLSGKTILPFTVHGGSGFSRTISTIQELQPGATVIEDGLSISRNSVAEAQSAVAEWMQGLDL